MFRSMIFSTILAAVGLANLCGCSTLPFQQGEPDSLSSLPAVEAVGWQERLARLKERGGRADTVTEERATKDRVAAAPKRGKKAAPLLDERLASTTKRNQRSPSKPAERDLTLGRWVKPTTETGRMRTFDVQQPHDSEPDLVGRTEPRTRQVERAVAYETPERTAAPAQVAGKSTRELPPIVEPFAPIVAAPVVTKTPAITNTPVITNTQVVANTRPTQTKSDTTKSEPVQKNAVHSKIVQTAQTISDPSLPDNRLRSSRVAAAMPARPVEPPVAKPIEPVYEHEADSVPWQTATFRSVEE